MASVPWTPAPCCWFGCTCSMRFCQSPSCHRALSSHLYLTLGWPPWSLPCLGLGPCSPGSQHWTSPSNFYPHNNCLELTQPRSDSWSAQPEERSGWIKGWSLGTGRNQGPSARDGVFCNSHSQVHLD